MALLQFFDYVFTLLYLALLLRVILSFVPGAFEHPAGAVIYRLTAPLLDPLRRVLPPLGGLDFSPLVAFLLLSVAQRVVREVLIGILF